MEMTPSKRLPPQKPLSHRRRQQEQTRKPDQGSHCHVPKLAIVSRLAVDKHEPLQNRRDNPRRPLPSPIHPQIPPANGHKIRQNSKAPGQDCQLGNNRSSRNGATRLDGGLRGVPSCCAAVSGSALPFDILVLVRARELFRLRRVESRIQLPPRLRRKIGFGAGPIRHVDAKRPFLNLENGVPHMPCRQFPNFCFFPKLLVGDALRRTVRCDGRRLDEQRLPLPRAAPQNAAFPHQRSGRQCFQPKEKIDIPRRCHLPVILPSPPLPLKPKIIPPASLPPPFPPPLSVLLCFPPFASSLPPSLCASV